MSTPDLQTSELQLRPLYPRDIDALEHWNGAVTIIPEPDSGLWGAANTQSLVQHPLAAWWQRLTTLALPNQPRWSSCRRPR